MAFDVASSINELLFEKNSVIVPGFGGFELQQQPANIDHIKSTISPPNKVPSFNKNYPLTIPFFISKNTYFKSTILYSYNTKKDFVVS